jgi:drug/metabolite transporter (DMT)-like permease
MPYFLLVLVVLLNSTSSIFGGYYNRACIEKKDSSSFFNFLQMASIFLCWLIYYLIDFSFDVKVIPYAIGMGIVFFGAAFGHINAMRTGPVMLSTLFLQLSLIATTIWGLIFWQTEINAFIIIGIILVVITLWLCLYTGKKETDKKISFKWLVYVFICFVSNASCTIIQREQQMAFDGKHGNLLMVIATGLALILFAIKFLKSDRSDVKFMLTKWYYPVLTGTCNMPMNLCVILLATSSLLPSLIYPVIGVGALIIVMLFSLFAFKEKLRWWQWLGVFCGAVATVLLSI